MSALSIATFTGTVLGSVARWFTLRIDYRQYPSYPQGYTIHMAFAVVAAFLGAVAVPAIVEKDFAAASFLALGATQFREIRKIERETLQNLEPSELVPRGGAYIEGIARVFEARNYLTMLISGAASAAVVVLDPFINVWPWGVLGGLAVGCVALVLVEGGGGGQHVGDLVDLEIAPITFEGPLLVIAGVAIMNIASESAQRRYLDEGLGVLMIPKNTDAKATMANIGQRQAIAHDASTLVGVTKEVDQPHLTPLVRRDGETGHIVMSIVPAEKSPEALLEAIRRVPVLESAVRRPTTSTAGRLVD